MTTISREQKLFELEEARSTLPLVSRIVRDIVEKTERMKEAYLGIRQEAEDDAAIICKSSIIASELRILIENISRRYIILL